MDAATIHRRRWGILSVLVVSLLVVVLDNTVLNVALKTIQEDLGATQSELEWSVNSYTLVFAGLLFTFGLLGDRFGRKRLLIGGLLLFGLASLVSAYSDSPAQLIAARSVMGIGAAAVMPATLAIITNVFEPKERGRAIGIWVASVGIAIVIGPVLGGALLETFWWGSVFLINVPIVVAGVVLVTLLVPDSRDPNPSKLDPAGVLLSMAGLVLLVFGIIEGGEQASIAPPEVWASVLGGAVLLGLFIWHERRTDHPALDVSLFRNPTFSSSVAIIGLVFLGAMGVVFVMSFYWQYARGYSPLETGLMFLPFAVAQFVFSPRSAAMVARFGVRAVVTSGVALMALTSFGLGFVDIDTSLWVLGALFFVQGAGMANIMPPLTTAVMASVPREKAGVGSGINNTVRQVGGALGVAVLGAVLAVQYRDAIRPELTFLPDGVRETASESLGSTLAIAEDVRDAAVTAFVDAMHTTAFAAAAVSALGTLIAVRYLPARQAAEEAPEPELVAAESQ